MNTENLTIESKVEENEIIVNLIGEVDIYSSTQLKEVLYKLVDENKVNLRINCSELNYIDSMGFGVFVGVLKKTKMNERNVYIVGLNDKIKKLFTITGLDKLFVIE